METKEFKIEIPEGFIIDINNSALTLGIVKFKKIDTRPRSWEEFCENYPVKKGEAFISFNKIFPIDEFAGWRSKNICTSKEEAEAFLALMQLRQLRKAWVGDWECRCSRFYYGIYYNWESKCFEVMEYSNINRSLNFPTIKMAKEFISCPEIYKLLEKAKILL